MSFGVSAGRIVSGRFKFDDLMFRLIGEPIRGCDFDPNHGKFEWQP
jgi:hypothetical protein